MELMISNLRIKAHLLERKLGQPLLPLKGSECVGDVSGWLEPAEESGPGSAC